MTKGVLALVFQERHNIPNKLELRGGGVSEQRRRELEQHHLNAAATPRASAQAQIL